MRCCEGVVDLLLAELELGRVLEDARCSPITSSTLVSGGSNPPLWSSRADCNPLVCGNFEHQP